MWDDRYADENYAYGTVPNQFFQEILDQYQFKGKILLPAEGEGRNAVYAAKKGLEVSAFDISIEGKSKALKLAKKEHVEINYEVGNFFELPLITDKFDVSALIFAHFPAEITVKYHTKIAELIKPSGFLILEGFSKKQKELLNENPQAGGPNNIDMLFSIESIKKDFPDFEPLLLEEREVVLDEGTFHCGVSRVIRFLGRKKG